MKNAPNLKKLPKDKFTEAIIFAGTDAYNHAKNWTEGTGQRIADDNTPPVYLGPRQLAELDDLQIIDNGRRYARVYRAGELSEAETTAIATRLALAGVEDARFYSESFELLEDWTPRLAGLKEEAELEEERTAVRHNLPITFGSEGFDREQDYTLKSYLPANSLCSIYGPSGSYKSFLAVSWACHIAAGIKWAGKRVSEGSVMYVVGEGGIGVPRRVRAWENVHGVKVDNLALVNRPVFPVRREEVLQVVKAARDIEVKKGKPVQLIVIDTLARCFGGNDENDAKDMGAFIEGCDTIKRETGATVLVVHHSGKDDTKGARGSSAFRAALDAEFNVRREGDGGAIILTCTKMKDAEEPRAAAFDLREAELFTDRDGELVASLVLRDTPREPQEPDPDLAKVKHLSDNHVAIWQSIRSRTSKGEPCNVSVIRDDIIALLGENGRKGYKRWLDKMVRENLIAIDEAGNVRLT